MDLGFYGTCTGCQTTKEAYEKKFSIMRHQFLEVKAKARNTDEMFATLADKDKQCVEAEGKLTNSRAMLQTYREQLRSYLKERMGHEERCKAYEATIKELRAACDRDACQVSTLTQVNAQLDLDLADARMQEAVAVAKAEKLKDDLNFSVRRVTELHAKLKKRSVTVKSADGPARKHVDGPARKHVDGPARKCVGDCEDELMARGLELSLLQDDLYSKTNELDGLKAKMAQMEAKTNEPVVKMEVLNGDEAERKISELETRLSLRSDELSSSVWEVEVLKKANGELESRLRREATKGDVTTTTTETATCIRTESAGRKSRETTNERRKGRIPSSKSSESSNELHSEKEAELVARLAERDAEVTKLTRDVERLRKSKTTKEIGSEKDAVSERRIADLETMLGLREEELSTFKRDAKNRVPGTSTVGDLEKQLSLDTRPALSKDKGAGTSSDDELGQLSLDTRPALSKGEAKNEVVGALSGDESDKTISEQGKQLDTRPAGERLSTELINVVQCQGCAERLKEVEALKRERSTQNKRLAVLTLSKESTKDVGLPCKGCAERKRELEALTGERSKQDDRLAALTRELEERGKEMKALKCAREADRNKSFEEKWRAAESRTFQLVAELAQLKAGAGAAHAARAKCGELEREVARLKAEVEGLLSKQPKPVFPWDTDHSSVKTVDSCNSSGIGSCLSIDLEDESLTFPDDVATIPDTSRTKTALEPIDESSDEEDSVVFRNIPGAAGKKIPEECLPGIASSAAELEFASKMPEKSIRAVVEKPGCRDCVSDHVSEDPGRKGTSNEQVFEILLRARLPIAPLSPIDGENDLRSQFDSLDVLAGRLRPCGGEDDAANLASRDLGRRPIGRGGRKYAPYEVRERDAAGTSQEKDLANLIESVKIVARSYSDFYGPGLRESRSIQSVPESGRDSRSTVVSVRPLMGRRKGERTQNDVGLPLGRAFNFDSDDARSEGGNSRGSGDDVVRFSPRNHPRKAESRSHRAASTKQNVSVQPSVVRRAAVFLSELPTLPEVVNASRPTKMSFKDVGKATRVVPSKAKARLAGTENEVASGWTKATECSRRARCDSERSVIEGSMKSLSEDSVKSLSEDSVKSLSEGSVKSLSEDSVKSGGLHEDSMNSQREDSVKRVNSSKNSSESRPANDLSSVVGRSEGKGVVLKLSGRRKSMSDLGISVLNEGQKLRHSSCSDLNLPSRCVEADLVTDLPKQVSLEVTNKSTSVGLTANNGSVSARLRSHSSKSDRSKESGKSSVNKASVATFCDAKSHAKTHCPEIEKGRVANNTPRKCLDSSNNLPSNLRRSPRNGQHAASSVDGNASSNEDKTKKWEDVLKAYSMKNRNLEAAPATSVPTVVNVSQTPVIPDIPRREPIQTRPTRNRKHKDAEINLDSLSKVKPYTVGHVRKSFELTQGQRKCKTPNANVRVLPHISNSFVKGETILAYRSSPSNSAKASLISLPLTSAHDKPPTDSVAVEKMELLLPQSRSQVFNEELVVSQKSGVTLSTQKEPAQTLELGDLGVSSERNITEETAAFKDGPQATEPEQTVLISDLDLSSDGSSSGDTSVFADGSTESVNTGRDKNSDAQIVPMEVTEYTSNVSSSLTESTDSEKASTVEVSTVAMSKDSGCATDLPGIRIEPSTSALAWPNVDRATDGESVKSPVAITSAMLPTDSTCPRIETCDSDAGPSAIGSLKREHCVETRPASTKQLKRESVVHALFGSSEDETSDSSPSRKPLASYSCESDCDDGSEREFAFGSANDDHDEPLSPLAERNPSDDLSLGLPVADSSRSRDLDSTRSKRQRLASSGGDISVDDLFDIIGVSPTRDRKLSASSEVSIPAPILPTDAVPALKIVPKPHIPISTVIGVEKIVPRNVSPTPVMPVKRIATVIVPSRQEVSKSILPVRRELHSNKLEAGSSITEPPLQAGKYHLRSIPPFVKKPSPTVQSLPSSVKPLPPTVKPLPPTEKSLTPTDVLTGAKFDPCSVIQPTRPRRRDMIRASVKPPSNSRACFNVIAEKSAIVGNVVEKSEVVGNVVEKSEVVGNVSSAWQTALRNLETIRWARENESSEDEDSEDEEEIPGNVAAIDSNSAGSRGGSGTASVVVPAAENVASVSNAIHLASRGKNFYVGPSSSQAGGMSADGSAMKRANFYGVPSSETCEPEASARGVKRKADEIDGDGVEQGSSRCDEKIASNEFAALDEASRAASKAGASTGEASKAGTSTGEASKAGTSTSEASKAGTSTGEASKAGTSTSEASKAGTSTSEAGEATGEWNERGYLLHKAFETYQAEDPRKARHQAANPPKKSKVNVNAMKWAADEALGRLYLMDNSEADEPTGRQAFDAIVEQLAIVDNATLVKNLLHAVSTDTGTVPPPPAAPPLTPTQRRVVTLGAWLDRTSRPGLLGELMEAIEQRVCHLGRVRQEESVTELMARAYAGLCAARDDMATLRCFLYDLLYCLNRSHRAVHAVLEVAPFALPHAFQAKEDLLAQTLVCTLLTKKDNEPLVNSPLARLLVERYKYNADNHITAPQIIAICVDRLKKGGELHSVEASLVLLAKRGGWHWADRHMAADLRSVLDLWRRSGGTTAVSDRAAEVALRVAAFVARTYPKDKVELGVRAMWRLQEVVLADKTSLHETAISCLLGLCSSHKNHRTEVAKLLLGWTPSAPPSPHLMERVVSFMANEPPTFWHHFFRRYAGAAGRRQAYVAFRGGDGGRAAAP